MDMIVVVRIVVWSDKLTKQSNGAQIASESIQPLFARVATSVPGEMFLYIEQAIVEFHAMHVES